MEKRQFDLEDRFVEFAALIIDIVEQLPDTRPGNHIAGQLLRSGTAPAPSYGEAQSAESRRDFIHKLKIALKELRETCVWLKLVRHKQLISSTRNLENALAECNELTAILASSISTAQRNLHNRGQGEYRTKKNE